MKKLIFSTTLVLSLGLAGCGEAIKTTNNVEEAIQKEVVNEDDLIQVLKDGVYEYYSKPDTRIEDAFLNFFSSPSWKCIEFKQSDDKNEAYGVVQFEGYFTYHEEEIKTTMLFRVYEKDKYFIAGKILSNGEPTGDGFEKFLLSRIYDNLYYSANYNQSNESTSSEIPSSQFDSEHDKDAIEDLVRNYVFQLAESVNNGEVSSVQWYLDPNSKFYNQQTNLVFNLNKKNITENVLDAQILDVRQLNNNTFEVDSYEQIEIIKQGVNDIKDFNWTYTVMYDGMNYYISDLK